jgi:hypothetical protein
LKKFYWLPGLALVGLVLSAGASAPAMMAAGDAPQLQKAATAKIPHTMVPIIDPAVRADMTTKEILIENKSADRPLILRLFRDFQKISPVDFVYYNKPLTVPLNGLSVYFVTISTVDGMRAVLFQLVQDRIHIIKMD